MEPTYEDNRKTVTLKRLENLVLLTSRTMSILRSQVDDGVLSTISSQDELIKFKQSLDLVLIAKLKNKFNL